MSQATWLAILGSLLRYPASRVSWRALSRITPQDPIMAELVSKLTSPDVMRLSEKDTELWLAGLPEPLAGVCRAALPNACGTAALPAMHEILASAELRAEAAHCATLLAQTPQENARHYVRDVAARLTRAVRLSGVVSHSLGEIASTCVKPTSEAAYCPTSFSRLDKVTHGYPRRGVAVIAARPGRGKTWWLIQEALAMAQQAPGLFFSCEMPADMIGIRMLASLARIDAWTLQSHRIGVAALSEREQRALEQAKEAAGKLPIAIIDNVRHVEEIASTAYEHALQSGIGWICVDYIQLLRAQVPREASRRELVAAVSNELVRIAMDAKVAVLAASQLRRPVGNETDPPSLSDLKESSDIEQDATLVIGLHVLSRNEHRTTLRVEILKHRSGVTGDVWNVDFETKTCQFVEAETYY